MYSVFSAESLTGGMSQKLCPVLTCTIIKDSKRYCIAPQLVAEQVIIHSNSPKIRLTKERMIN